MLLVAWDRQGYAYLNTDTRRRSSRDPTFLEPPPLTTICRGSHHALLCMGFFALETYTVPVRAMERFRLRGLSLAHFGKEAQLYDEVQRNRRAWEES